MLAVRRQHIITCTEAPTMPPRIRFLFSTMSVTLFFVAAVPLYQELSRRSDIWWTPRTMLVPLAESADRVEIYARGRPLGALLQAGQVQQLGSGPSRASARTPRVRGRLRRRGAHVPLGRDGASRLSRREGRGCRLTSA